MADLSYIRIPGDTRRKPQRPIFDPAHSVNRGVVLRTAPFLMGGSDIINLVNGKRIGFSGGTPTWAREKGEAAVDFSGSGSGDYIDTGIKVLAGWSFGVWYTMDAITTFDAHGTWSNLGTGARSYVGFFDSGGGLDVAGFGSWTSSNAGALDTNKVYAHIMSSDATNAYWWQEGKLIDSGAHTFDNAEAKTFFIGGRNSTAVGGLDNEFDGRILQVIIWNRYVPPTEAALLTKGSFYAGLVAPRWLPIQQAAVAGGLSIPIAMHHYTKNLRALS